MSAKSHPLPIPTAGNINDAHRCAKESAENAVEWAMKCGQLLKAKKDEVGHGNWGQWVERNCEFSYRVARKYVQVAEEAASQNGTRVPFSTMAKLLGYEKPPQKPDTSARSVKGAVMNPPESAAQGSEAGNRETPIGADAGRVRPPVPGPDPVLADDDWTPEIPDEDELAATEREVQESEAKILRADDVTAGYHAELKRQAAEIAVLRVSRDGYMNGKLAVTKLLKTEQAKVARLEKKLKAAEDEIEKLRKRVAMAEAA